MAETSQSFIDVDFLPLGIFNISVEIRDERGISTVYYLESTINVRNKIYSVTKCEIKVYLFDFSVFFR